MNKTKLVGFETKLSLLFFFFSFFNLGPACQMSTYALRLYAVSTALVVKHFVANQTLSKNNKQIQKTLKKKI